MEKRGFWGFAFLLSLCTFLFCLDAKEKVPKRKNQDCIFSATPLRNFRGQKELATLKQLFVLIRKSLRSALRCENEVGVPCGWALGIGHCYCCLPYLRFFFLFRGGTGWSPDAPPGTGAKRLKAAATFWVVPSLWSGR